MASQRKGLYDGQFDNILNFRDVGKTINDFLGRKYEVELYNLEFCRSLKN